MKDCKSNLCDYEGPLATYVLQITSPDERIQTIEITKSTAIIGRVVGDVIIDDPRCSGRHAELEIDDRGLRIKDLGSTNGTFFGEKPVTEMLWPVRATLRIGKHKLTLLSIRSDAGTLLQTNVPIAPESRRAQRPGIIGGVCASLADYVGINASFVRVVFCILALWDGLGILAYLALWALQSRKRDEVYRAEITPKPLAAIREHPAMTYSVGVIGILATLAKAGGDVADIVKDGKRFLDLFGPTQPNEHGFNALRDAPSDSVRDEIRRFIVAADEAEAQAYSTMNPTLLANYYADDLLAASVNSIMATVSEGVAHHNKLEGQTFHAIEVSADGQQARASLTETWSGVGRALDGRCVWRVPRHDVPQTMSLVRRGVGWRIVHSEHAPVQIQQVGCFDP